MIYARMVPKPHHASEVNRVNLTVRLHGKDVLSLANLLHFLFDQARQCFVLVQAFLSCVYQYLGVLFDVVDCEQSKCTRIDAGGRNEELWRKNRR